MHPHSLSAQASASATTPFWGHVSRSLIGYEPCSTAAHRGFFGREIYRRIYTSWFGLRDFIFEEETLGSSSRYEYYNTYVSSRVRDYDLVWTGHLEQKISCTSYNTSTIHRNLNSQYSRVDTFRRFSDREYIENTYVCIFVIRVELSYLRRNICITFTKFGRSCDNYLTVPEVLCWPTTVGRTR